MKPDHSTLINSLAMRPLFVGLNDGQLAQIVAAGRLESYDLGQTILSEGMTI